jgi:ABC-2 type transport system ATP-binding protein
MEKVIEIQGIVKKYGKKTALDNISFNVNKKSCFGLLGPNGAGKSTIMKILAGIIDFESGNLKVLKEDVSKASASPGLEIRRRIGYVPQEITIYDKLSAYNNLRFFGELYGVKGRELNNRIEEVLELVGLKDRAKDLVHIFSGGMKRRINIAAALLHKPELLILDEPTVGVDPQSRNHIFNIIKSLKAEGVTTIYSTHYMEEVEALCDDIAIIDNGKVLAQGQLSELIDKYGTNNIYVESSSIKTAPDFPLTKKVYNRGMGWVVETDHVLQTIRNISDWAIKENITMKELGIVRPSLETIFLTLTGTTLRD